MLASVRAFFEHLIDFAGLFPPASLPLEQALGDYVQYRQGPNSWMLGRFIIPAARLPELPAFSRQIAQIAPLRLTVLGRGGKDADEFFAHVHADLLDIARLDDNLKDAVLAESYEVKLPASLFGPAGSEKIAELFPLIDKVRSLLDSSLSAILAPFFEFPQLEPGAILAVTGRIYDDEMRMHELLHHLDSRQDDDLSRFPRPGWKLRCGGLEASAFPAAEAVAAVLHACCQAGIPWKATAGLHQPFHHFDAGLKVGVHGFVNVLAAGILAHAQLLEPPVLVELLADENPGHFSFAESSFTWKDHRATTEAIRSARKRFVTSFGSCSFMEPSEELRKLGWLP